MKFDETERFFELFNQTLVSDVQIEENIVRATIEFYYPNFQSYGSHLGPLAAWDYQISRFLCTTGPLLHLV